MMPAAQPSGNALDRRASGQEADVTTLRRTDSWLRLDLRDVWRYRELGLFLAWRDISVRYKQTVLGALWAVLQPLFLMVVFTVIFGILVRVPSQDLPYPLFVYAGLVPWQLFAFALVESSSSVVANERLITKVYFPRLLIPFASVMSGLVDFGVSLVLLAGLLLIYHVPPAANAWALPLFGLLGLSAALGIGLWLAALNVRYRDVRYTLPFLTQLWFFATPVTYPSSLVPETWRPVLALNPMAGVVDGFRWALLGTPSPSAMTLAISVAAASVLLLSGMLYFRAMERSFADVI